MTPIRTLLGLLTLAVSATAQNEQLQFLIEPGAFRPGNFSTPAPDEVQRGTLRAKAREAQQAVQMGIASHAEQMKAEIAAQYADMRLSQGARRKEQLRKLAEQSNKLQQLLAKQEGAAMASAWRSLAARVKAAYYTAALQKDAASANALLQAAETYLHAAQQRLNSGLADRTELLLAEIAVQEATLLSSNGKNALATLQKYHELAELLAARTRSGFAPAAPAEQAAEAARTFACEWAKHRK